MDLSTRCEQFVCMHRWSYKTTSFVKEQSIAYDLSYIAI